MPEVTEYKGCTPCEQARQARQAARMQLIPRPPNYLRRPNTDSLGEYAQHIARGGAVYSAGHRRMYTGTLELIRGSELPPVDVIEVGVGIGYGLGLMLEAGIVRNYTGVEVDQATYEYVEERYGDDQRVTLYNASLNSIHLQPAPFVYCIEVIEHVPEEALPGFLQELRRLTLSNLFLSTPDGSRYEHGVATAGEWKKSLRSAGFNVVALERQWTTLYLCEPA